MKNLLAQKGCHATLLHNDTWSLTLPNGYTLELCFDSEIELCDFLEDLPDMNPVPSTLHARGYTSQRSNTALTSGQTLHQQRQVPPVNINLRAISGRQENGVPKRTQKGSSEVSGHESYIRGDIRETIIMFIVLFMVFKALVNEALPSGVGWIMLFGYAVGKMVVPVVAGVIAYYLFSNAKKRMVITQATIVFVSIGVIIF